LLRTWKDEKDRSESRGDWDYFCALGRGTVEHDGVQQSSQLQQQVASPSDMVSGGTFLAVTQSPQSVVSDGSPTSQYPTAPAASPVTVNSMVFNPPPRALVSLTPTAVCPTTSSVPAQPLVMDRRSNPDSGYGSKIYHCRGTGPAVDEIYCCRGTVDAGQEHHVVSAVEADAHVHSGVCSSFPDVVVDRPLYQSGQRVATLPRAGFEDMNVPSGRRCCHGDAGSLSPNLDLRTYSETNLVVSPRRAAGGRWRVPIELADENSIVDVCEVLSPTSRVSEDSICFITDKVTDFVLSSPTNNVLNTVLPLQTESYQAVPHETKYLGIADLASANERLYYDMSSASEARNERLGSRNLSIITKDAGLTSRECESCVKTDNFCGTPVSADNFYGTPVSADNFYGTPVSAEGLLDNVTDILDSGPAAAGPARSEMMSSVPARRLPIGRSTTV